MLRPSPSKQKISPSWRDSRGDFENSYMNFFCATPVGTCYAAPEQRFAGQVVNEGADIYALGLVSDYRIFKRQYTHHPFRFNTGLCVDEGVFLQPGSVRFWLGGQSGLVEFFLRWACLEV